MTPKSNAPVPFRPEAGLPATDPAASQAMLDSLSDPFIWLDPEWRVRYLNPAAARLLRRGLAELAGHNVWDSYPDLAGSGYHDACRAVAATGQPAAHTGYYAPLASWFEARAFPARDGIVLVLRDVSHVHAKISQLRYQATHDYLTGLPNRRQLMDTLSGAIAEAAAGLGRQRTLLAVLFLDLDRFKEVNDTFGHAEGDALLRDVAERLRRFQTPSIFCARAGGDEFALVLRDTTERAAEALANSLLNLLSMPHQIHGRPVSLGASIGIATMNSPADSADVLLAYADAAMYAAKAAGRSQVRVYRHELSPGLQERNAARRHPGRAGRQPVRAAFPAPGRHAQRRHLRRRGAAALAPSVARPARTGLVPGRAAGLASGTGADRVGGRHHLLAPERMADHRAAHPQGLPEPVGPAAAGAEPGGHAGAPVPVARRAARAAGGRDHRAHADGRRGPGHGRCANCARPGSARRWTTSGRARPAWPI